MESADIDGTLTLFFHSAHAAVNFSVFPSHYYLYGFEVEEACRGKGYGTGFLKEVLCRLWNLPANSPSCPPLFAELSSVRDASALSLRPVLLQVTGDNAPALALYKKNRVPDHRNPVLLSLLNDLESDRCILSGLTSDPCRTGAAYHCSRALRSSCGDQAS